MDNVLHKHQKKGVMSLINELVMPVRGPIEISFHASKR